MIPARYLSTSCLAKNATGPTAATPLFSPPPPVPQAAVTTGSLPSLSLPSSPPPHVDPQPPPASRPPPAPSAPAAATCSAAYSSMGPYVQVALHPDSLSLPVFDMRWPHLLKALQGEGMLRW